MPKGEPAAIAITLELVPVNSAATLQRSLIEELIGGIE
jgi:hypothetical protein